MASHIKIAPSTRAKIYQLAALSGAPESTIVENAINEYVERHAPEITVLADADSQSRWTAEMPSSQIEPPPDADPDYFAVRVRMVGSGKGSTNAEI